MNTKTLINYSTYLDFLEDDETAGGTVFLFLLLWVGSHSE